jgi:hypothetical protein
VSERLINVNGREVDKAKLLVALHNNTGPLGLGILHDIGRDLTLAEAERDLEALSWRFEFDYYRGRPLKVYADGGEIRNGGLYDRDAGEGAFDRAVAEACS